MEKCGDTFKNEMPCLISAADVGLDLRLALCKYLNKKNLE